LETGDDEKGFGDFLKSVDGQMAKTERTFDEINI